MGVKAEKTDGTSTPIRINHPTIGDKVRRRYSQTFTFPQGTTKISIRTGFVSISYAWMCFDGFKLDHLCTYKTRDKLIEDGFEITDAGYDEWKISW